MQFLALKMEEGARSQGMQATSENESESCSVVSDSLWPHGLYSPWNSPGQSTGVGSFSLLQGIFPTHGLNPDLHCRQILYQLSQKGSPRILEYWSGWPIPSPSDLPDSWIKLRSPTLWADSLPAELCYEGSPSNKWKRQEERKSSSVGPPEER